MLDIGWTEMLVIAFLVIVVVGPKDLPVVMRKAGKWVRKMRGFAQEFRSGLDTIMRESELDEIKKQAEAASAATTDLLQQHQLDAAGLSNAMLGQTPPNSKSTNDTVPPQDAAPDRQSKQSSRANSEQADDPATGDAGRDDKA